MQGSICKCIFNQYIHRPFSTLSTVLDLLCSLFVIICGLIANYRFKVKLDEEKRNTLPGRKGNVIEPIMRTYVIIAGIFWPYEMIFLWMNAHEIIPCDWFSNCWLMNILMHPIRIGRTIIGYNSFFVAFIRYLYIVHDKKSNQWNFEKTGRLFQVASILVPIAMEAIRILTEFDVPGLKQTKQFRECVATSEGLNSTLSIVIPPPATVALTLQLFPLQLVHYFYYINMAITLLLSTNIIEAYFYLKCFQIARRSVST